MTGKYLPKIIAVSAVVPEDVALWREHASANWQSICIKDILTTFQAEEGNLNLPQSPLVNYHEQNGQHLFHRDHQRPDY